MGSGDRALGSRAAVLGAPGCVQWLTRRPKRRRIGLTSAATRRRRRPAPLIVRDHGAGVKQKVRHRAATGPPRRRSVETSRLTSRYVPRHAAGTDKRTSPAFAVRATSSEGRTSQEPLRASRHDVHRGVEVGAPRGKRKPHPPVAGVGTSPLLAPRCVRGVTRADLTTRHLVACIPSRAPPAHPGAGCGSHTVIGAWRQTCQGSTVPQLATVPHPSSRPPSRCHGRCRTL